MQKISSEEVLPTANQPQFAESELVEYGKIDEITQAGSSGSSDGGGGYS